MEVKYTIQGLLIYAAMSAYLVAFVVSILGWRKVGRVVYFSAFVIAVSVFVYRWIDVRHLPMQNLFEVFIVMGVLVWPLSILSRRILSVGGETVDMLIGVVVLVPAGFVFDAQPQQLPPALQCWLFGPHVAVYMITYVIMAKAAVQAVGWLCMKNNSAKGTVDYESGTYRMVSLGFPLMSLALVLGSWWGNLAWGDYWGWDPKELWSLVTWLIYAGYFHFRYMFGKKHSTFNSLWAITGMAAVIITLLWVNLANIFSGLHSYA